MRKKFLPNLFLLSLLAFSTEIMFAQKKDSVSFGKTALYAELAGNGVGGSVNIERALLKDNTGFFTIRIGLSFDDGQKIFPILLNHVFGKGNNHFEMGGGVQLPLQHDYGPATANFMYRYQKPNGKFLFRIGWTPIFVRLASSLGLLNFWIGASVGVVF
jgi:hypothetical protein